MRIAICDDMQLFLDELHEMILKYCPEDLKPVMVDEFHSGEEFLESFSFGKYDAVILDIEMKQLNGILMPFSCFFPFQTNKTVVK